MKMALAKEMGERNRQLYLTLSPSGIGPHIWNTPIWGVREQLMTLTTQLSNQFYRQEEALDDS